MGRVQVDIYGKDKLYYDYSLSSEMDIYKILWSIDVIKGDGESGNKEAVVLFRDFINLIKAIDNVLLYRVIAMYVNIQLGKVKLTIDDYDKPINHISARELKISKKKYDELLHKAILEMIKINEECFIEASNKKYKNTILYKSSPSEANKVPSKIDDEKYYQLDYIQKYVDVKAGYKNTVAYNTTESLNDLLNENRKKIKLLTKVEDKDDKQKAELRKRIKFNKNLQNDINAIKENLGTGASARKKRDVETISYDDAKKNGELDGLVYQEQQSTSLESEWQAEQIKKIAQKVLTNKQLIIFYLYHINNLNQSQISKIIGDTQGNISRDLKIAINKIKENL